ncbi:hypothetical protein [Streptomyces sp. NPDC088789]|uniref:hypothetical protein n=1 Tax=Streptomyces sp. NPDC088789 TaxID=3365899 RepID=UPI0038218828
MRKALVEARPAGASLTQLCHATRRTPSQVWAGIRFLRKVAVKEGIPPVTHSLGEGFQLSEDPEKRDELHWLQQFVEPYLERSY